MLHMVVMGLDIMVVAGSKKKRLREPMKCFTQALTLVKIHGPF